MQALISICRNIEKKRFKSNAKAGKGGFYQKYTYKKVDLFWKKKELKF